MKDKIEEKLNGIYMMQKKNDETGEQETIYVFTGDDEETAHDASLKVIMDYAIRLKNQTNLVTQVLKQKSDISVEEAMSVIKMLSDPQYVYDIAFQEEDAFETGWRCN